MDVFLVGEGCGSFDMRKICLERNVRILGWLDSGRSVTLRSKVATLDFEAVTRVPFDLVIITNQQFAGCRQTLAALGIPEEKVLEFQADIPAALRRLGPVQNFAYRSRGTSDSYVALPFQGLVTEDARTRAYGEREAALAARLCQLFRACRAGFEGQDPVYQPGANWSNFLRTTRRPLYEAVEAQDLPALHGLLANFWRNPLGEGIIAGEAAYRGYCATSEASHVQALLPYLFALLQSLGEDIRPADLDVPRIGNPFGVLLDGSLVQDNSVMNRYRAGYLLGLLEDVQRPVIAEIGGGVGFLAHALLRGNPEITYLNFDLPEILVVQAYFLSTAFPDKRILYYDGRTISLDRGVFDDYDIVLMPNYMLPSVQDRSIDLFVNTISFGEMSLENVDNYLHQVERVVSRFFYHENLVELNFDYENYAADFFRVPEGLRQVFSAPSRWPCFGQSSRHHVFIESLYARRSPASEE